MSRFRQILEAKKAAAFISQEEIKPAQAIEPTESTELFVWTTRKGETKVAATKPGFGWTLVGPAPTEATQPVPTLPIPTIQAEPATEPALYWKNRINGEFAASPKKPGFAWVQITQEEFTALVEATGNSSIESPTAESSLEAAGFTLSNIKEAFEKARFTKEEAAEEAEAIADLLKKDPLLERVLAESPVPLNANQLLAAYYARMGKSFVLTGAAGTGKTTAQAATIDILDKEAVFSTHNFKYIGTAPSIAVVAFTKVAVRNIQKAIRKNDRIAHYADHCMTIHALLEFEPEVEEREDADGSLYNVRIFRPQRHRLNPLSITHLIIEEASMVGLDLFRLLADALLPGVQIVYLGDINQLQPIFSNPILAYALVKLPVIELTRVYRQALDNPIIFNAHEVLKGRTITTSPCGKVSVVTGTSKVQVGQSKMALAIKTSLKKLYEAGHYDPEEDQILLPWNKQDLGTKSINNYVASFLGAARNALVYQVRAGRHTWWLAEGDKVLVDKRVGLITNIQENPKYIGGATAPAGFYTRDGTPLLGLSDTVDFDEHSALDNMDYADFSMDLVETEEGARAASHVVSIAWMDTEGATGMLHTAGDFADSKFDFAYAMTVHKAQGSEYRKVFMALHNDHYGFISRELMYTALTRAREEFVLFAKEDLVAAACKKQEVKGNSLQDKIAFFTSGALGDLEQVQVEFPIEE